LKENVVQRKSYFFALRIVGLHRYLMANTKEHVLSRQVLRSGTSTGANIEEAIGSQSSKEFYAKLSIAYREARETHYWIRLLRDSNTITHKAAASMLNDCNELLRIITSIRKTLKK
jgi:four helix bundle protein